MLDAATVGLERACSQQLQRVAIRGGDELVVGLIGFDLCLSQSQRQHVSDRPLMVLEQRAVDAVRERGRVGSSEGRECGRRTVVLRAACVRLRCACSHARCPLSQRACKCFSARLGSQTRAAVAHPLTQHAHATTVNRTTQPPPLAPLRSRAAHSPDQLGNRVPLRFSSAERRK